MFSYTVGTGISQDMGDYHQEKQIVSNCKVVKLAPSLQPINYNFERSSLLNFRAILTTCILDCSTNIFYLNHLIELLGVLIAQMPQLHETVSEQFEVVERDHSIFVQVQYGVEGTHFSTPKVGISLFLSSQHLVRFAGALKRVIPLPFFLAIVPSRCPIRTTTGTSFPNVF